MQKLNYSDLDAALLAKLQARPLTFADMAYGGAVLDAATALEKQYGKPDVNPAWRFVDARLQALRRAGRIEFAGPKTGWKIVQQKAPS